MIKRKISTTTKVMAIILLITMVALTIISGTFAKYTSYFEGSDTATVAKWVVGFDGDKTINLFSNTGVYDLNEVTDKNDLSSEKGAVDEDVVKSGKKVAPGTWGKVTLSVTNESDVAAKAKLAIKEINTTLPLQFSVDGKTWVKADNAVNGVDFKEISLEVGSTAKVTKTAELYWKWDFETDPVKTNDDTETELGKAGTATCDITVSATFTQVD